MTLSEDLARWMSDRPDWQKDAFRRFCRNEILSADDVVDIADKLIAGTYPLADDVSPEDIPGSIASGEPVKLTQLSGVDGVNALLSEQTLPFAENGLTVIYGDNASGKSGYARLIREAVTARVKADQLLGDVFSEDDIAQRAKFDFVVGSNTSSWSLGDGQSLELSRIRFYDEDCGDAYVTKAAEVNYRPSALTILDQLSDACEAVANELARRSSENVASKPNLPVLHEGTPAFGVLSALSAETTELDINAATALPSNHSETLATQLAEESRLKSSDPAKEKTRLGSLAMHWSTIEAYMTKLIKVLDESGLKKLADEREQALNLRAAARIASNQSFETEPLEGVGSETWRALWAAARDYSETEAYHEHSYPVSGAADVCVLCQQPLGVAGSDRMSRFQKFMTDTTARDADTAEKTLATSKESLKELKTLSPAVTNAVSKLKDGGESTQAAQDHLNLSMQIATDALDWLNGTKEKVPAPIEEGFAATCKARSDELTRGARAIDDSSFNETLAGVSKRVLELQDAKALHEAKSALLVEVKRQIQLKKINEAKRATSTTGLTTKRVELTEAYVTQEVRDRFTRETEGLALRKVTLDRTGRGRSSALEHQPKLLGSRREAGVHEVLSEGEQTALGLAGFLTEVELDASMSGVVFDDPVSSLDAGRRSRVAKRLVKLAQDRQVIIFTHEATFVNALNKTARDHDLKVTQRAILRRGEQPGLVSDKHPWSVKDIPARINELEASLARLRKARDEVDTDEYTRRAQEWGGMLSQAWERAVNIDIANELVDRGTNEVRPKMFKMLVGIDQRDNNDYQSGYAKASEWAPRHDQAPDTNFVAPDPDELEEELTRFKDWVARIKRYRSA